MVQYTEWRSISDGSIISSIPDSGGTHQWNYQEGDGLTISDQIGSLDISFTGGSWQTGEGVGEVYLKLDGSDDYGDLGSDSRSELSHIVNDGEGTFFLWAYADYSSGDDRSMLFGNNLSTNRSFMIYVDDDSGQTEFRCGNGDEYMFEIRSGPQPPSNDWVAFAATANGSEATLYFAEPPEYELIEVGSDTVGSTASGDLEDFNVFIGTDQDEGGRFWDGGVDYSFTDTSGWTESELQKIVDDTKGFYQ